MNESSRIWLRARALESKEEWQAAAAHLVKMSERFPSLAPLLAMDIERLNRTSNKSKPVNTNASGGDDKGLSRLVFVVGDLSAIGGIANRTRTVLTNCSGRLPEYFVFSRRHSREISLAHSLAWDKNPKEIERAISEWDSNETVFFLANNALSLFPENIQERVKKFPLVYIAAGQMAFIIQDSPVLSNLDYVENFRASRIISFSDSDINFQRQLGIHGQVKGFVPVAMRTANGYRLSKNRYFGYVGRIDFHTKGCERLIDIAAEFKRLGMSSLRIFTTNGKNSPDLPRFLAMIKEHGLEGQFVIEYNCEDKEVIFDQLRFLILPSRKESFGNVVVEALSFGVPVLAASYAPGPAELVDHGQSGLLLDDLSGDAVVQALCRLSDADLERMSAAAFERHKHFSIESHLDFLEEVAKEVLSRFDGQNRLPILPRLKVLDKLYAVQKTQKGKASV
jgi:glycosyltransferase involved in cell wall biosynthesis